jgi:quercetin 2,3-dioxygenase
MIKIRKSDERGHFDHGWLKTFHTFSFGEYRNPGFMGYRSLRVINDDRVQPGEGFPTHFHRDMEILTYILKGSLEHKDSMGTGAVIQTGELQYMSAGSGVEHSEFNPSESDEVHLLQIWILPDRSGYEPRYQQINPKKSDRNGKLQLVASPDGRDGSIAIRQNAELYLSVLSHDERAKYPLSPDSYYWLHLAKGELEWGGTRFREGDGAAMEQENVLELRGVTPSSELLLFKLR